jgi:hypothetical protein
MSPRPVAAWPKESTLPRYIQKKQAIPWAAALGAVLTLALGCGGHSQAPTSSGAVRSIPWLDRAGVPNQLAGTVLAARACGARDLVLTIGPSGAHRGMATQELRLRNQGRDACFIAGAPRSQLADVRAQGGVSSERFSALRLDLQPGQSANLMIGAPVGCAASASPRLSTHIEMTLPNGDLVAANGTRVDTECGPARVVDFSPVAPAVAPSPLGVLRVSLIAPRSAAHGAVLTYRITLTNPSSRAIALSPCPSYTESVGTGPAIQRTLVMNCAAATFIRAGASLVYEMRLPLPQSAAHGPARLYWRLEVAYGPTAGSAISIT